MENKSKQTVTFTMQLDEAANLVSLLSIANETFSTMASAALSNGDLQLQQMLHSRAQISQAYAQLFINLLQIPEPTSKLLH